MTAYFAVDRLDHHYGSAQNLRGVSLAMKEGQCLALRGRNGAGKTTLLRCLAGLLAPSAGQIALQGRDISGWPPFRRIRGGIGYVPQGREIFAGLSVGENMLIGQKAHGGAEGHAGRGLRPVPRPARCVDPARRRPFRRPAAATGGRPRADGPPLPCCCWTSRPKGCSLRSSSRSRPSSPS